METGNINLSIVTPYGEIFNDEVKSVNLPGAEGEFGVLPGHCDFLSLLKVGVIEIYKKDENRELVAINWGYAEVSSSRVDIIANGAVAIHGNSDSEISKAIGDAKSLLEEAASDKVVLSSILSKIETNAKQLL
ncbi:ATP synthase F1 subunit epsilon [Helicobacter sp. MIT 14-3879]|uniref:ATP synthase F1 subunit epsilon n=1 Tax=Helicobacter sp. MIT 14-3879 TaxID=2040649 RepID=UPI000E1E9030|nr:ATP synthase F1 subunit epsilon [Helicobacter sp. MIT 14-3879]RDU63168.1 F0F1 ATP synthase subunit epsilon [Helicobacter sp. MIT 14-3879]